MFYYHWAFLDFILPYMCDFFVASVYVWILYEWVPGVHRIQKRALGPLKLKLNVCEPHKQAGNRPKSSGRPVSALHHGVISPALTICCETSFSMGVMVPSSGPHACTLGTFCMEWPRGTSWDDILWLLILCLFSFCWSCANKNGLNQNSFSANISFGHIWSCRVFICLIPRNGS